MLGKALDPLTDTLKRLAKRLEIEGDNAYRAHVDAMNGHFFKGVISEADEAAKIRQYKPSWADVGKPAKYKPLKYLTKDPAISCR